MFTWFVSQQKQLAVTSKVGLEGFLGQNFPDCGLVVKLEIGDSSANKSLRNYKNPYQNLPMKAGFRVLVLPLREIPLPYMLLMSLLRIG